MLLDQLTEDMKNALRNREELKLSVLRMTVSECKYARVEKMRDLEDADVIAVIKKGIKSREDASRQFRDAGRAEMADKEETEAEFLRAYLPEQLSGEALDAIVSAAIQEAGATSMKEMGKVMKIVLGAHGATVDGKAVQKLIHEKLGKA